MWHLHLERQGVGAWGQRLLTLRELQQWKAQIDNLFQATSCLGAFIALGALSPAVVEIFVSRQPQYDAAGLVRLFH